MKTLNIPTIEDLQNENIQLRNEVSYLKEQLSWFQRQLFGKRSEKTVKSLDGSGILFLPGAEEWFIQQSEEKKEIIPAHTRKRPKRTGQDSIEYPEDLPVERIELDLAENEKICAETGKPLVKIGEEISRKLAKKPAAFFIKEYVRPKYALPKDSTGGIVTAELPDSIIPKCRADESLLADILTMKFADHLPLYRICQIHKRDDVRISRQLLSQWIVKIGDALEPIYDEMLKRVLGSGNIFVDESPVKVLIKGCGKAHQGYMWVIVGGKVKDPPYRIYDFHLSREHKNITDQLKDYVGTLHSDKYGAYEKLALKKTINWSPCWSHIRRKFIDVESGDLEFRDWIIRKIKYLFMFEKVAWKSSEEERIRIRREKEIPIIDELVTAIKNKLIHGQVLPKCKLKTALQYFYGLVPHLKNYTTDPYARIENNVAERAIRPLAIGRKNWLFMGSPNGGRSAATILSLVQTCRGLDINPREYLEDILRRIMGHSANKIDELLPDNWFKSRP